MGPDDVRYERVGSTAVVTIDRPGHSNAVDGATAVALAQCLSEFEGDPDARVLILTGAGRTFCAGADLTALESLRDRVFLPGGPEGFTRLSPSKPTIAAISGWCVAGGLELALWCDLRICTGSSQFGFLERRWGVPLLDGGTQRLPRIVGLGRALDLILTGRIVAAAEAAHMGLVSQVVTDGEHLDAAHLLAERLAGYPQEAMLSDRRATIDGIGRTLVDGMWLEARLGGTAVQNAMTGAARFTAGAGRGGDDA